MFHAPAPVQRSLTCAQESTPTVASQNDSSRVVNGVGPGVAGRISVGVASQFTALSTLGDLYAESGQLYRARSRL